MKPDQTVPLGAVQSGFIGYLRNIRVGYLKADDQCHDWRVKG